MKPDGYMRSRSQPTSVGTTRLKPDGRDKGRPYWVVAGIMYFDEKRAEKAQQEVLKYYSNNRYNGD